MVNLCVERGIDRVYTLFLWALHARARLERCSIRRAPSTQFIDIFVLDQRQKCRIRMLRARATHVGLSASRRGTRSSGLGPCALPLAAIDRALRLRVHQLQLQPRGLELTLWFSYAQASSNDLRLQTDAS